MSKSNNFHRDCTEQCRSLEHGDLVNNSFSICDVSGLQLCSYINYLCKNCDSVKDSVGRTALHTAASYGYLEVVKWLLYNRNANINAKDDESGYTPLHRALYFGRLHVAVELLKAGADLTIEDKDGLTPYDHIVRDGPKPLSRHGWLYLWGLNKNNSLGSFNSKNAPECLDSFHKKYPEETVQQICIDNFHTIMVTVGGHVFSCGHGLGGRLGLGTENTAFEHTEIIFPENVFVRHASIARDHSLFLTSTNEVYSCGQNTHKVLGLSPPPQNCLSPEKVKSLQSKIITGICTARYHSVAWTKQAVYVWGLNGGQLGLACRVGYNVISPRLAFNSKEFSIKKVVASDGATAVSTQRGDTYLFHNFTCRKVVSRLLNIKDLAIMGGTLNLSSGEEVQMECPKEIKIVFLTLTGLVYLWRETDTEVYRLIFSIPRLVSYISLNYSHILFVTDFGECYKGAIKDKIEKLPWNKKNLTLYPTVYVTTSRIPKAYRASAIVSDPKGENYAVIQQRPYTISYEKNIMKREMEGHLNKFFTEISEEDNIHEILIRIDHRKFPAHKFILATESRLLDLCDNENEIKLDNVNFDFFQQILCYMYTGYCSLLEPGECPVPFIKYISSFDGLPQEIEISKIKKSAQDPIRMLQEMAKRFGCKKLYNILKDYYMENILIYRKGNITRTLKCFRREDFPEHYDISLKCSDNIEIKAHKCILIARLEYFSCLFAARWNNDNKINIDIPYTSNLVEALLHFVYTDSDCFLLDKDADFLLKLLVLSDEYLVEQLKNCCSFLIMKQNYVNLRNATEILQIAYQVKSTFLKDGVMKFIVQNLHYFFENKVLHDLPDDVLFDLAMKYVSESKLDRRLLSYTISSDLNTEIVDIHAKHPINLEISEKKKTGAIKKIPKSRSKVSRKSVSEKILQKDSDDEEKPDYREIPSPEEMKEKVPIDRSIQDRLAAISLATRIMETSSDEPKFTNLRNLSLSDSFNDFPLLNSATEGIYHRLSTPSNSTKGTKRHKPVRLSQKERLRLSSESKETGQGASEIPKNPWHKIPDSCQVSTSPSDSSFCETPKSAWKKIPDPPENVATSPSDSTFCDILLDERKLKENLVKYKNKQLVHAQIEDKAIMDLEKFYNIKEVEDEVITVDRISIGNIASPVWIPGNRPSGFS